MIVINPGGTITIRPRSASSLRRYFVTIFYSTTSPWWEAAVREQEKKEW